MKRPLGFKRKTLQSIFELFYRWGNWIYDPITRIFFGNDWHEWRLAAVPYIRGEDILEIGCGTGQFLQELETEFKNITAIDLSDAMIQRAQERATRANVVQASADRLPFADRAFDSIVSTFPANYIVRKDTLNEIARVLRPGGAFVVVGSARFERFRWSRAHTHLLMRIAYGQTESLSRLPSEQISHPGMPGQWIDAKTRNGTAFVWLAEKCPG